MADPHSFWTLHLNLPTPSPQVVLENQRLGMGAREFTDNSKRLADEGVLPGCRLWVVDTGEHSNRDIAGEAVGGHLSRGLL